MREFSGIPAAPGYAVGPVRQFRRAQVRIQRRSIGPDEVAGERDRFEAAVAHARRELTELRDKLARELGHDEAAILDSQLLMLEDELVWDATLSRIRTQLVNAEAAFAKAIADIVLQFNGLQEQSLRERIADLRDLEDRVQRAFLNETAVAEPPWTEAAVVAARDLVPSETAALDRDLVLGFVTDEGGSTSHVAILARSLGIPAVCGLGGVASQLPAGTTVAVDGNVGRLIAEPDPETRDRLLTLKQQQITVSRKLDYLRDLPAETPDGRRVRMATNIELPVELDEALARGAEGVGLLRTEYLYFQHRDIPSEEDQVKLYTRVVQRLAGRPVVFRTLDVGGDKVSDYLGAKREYNPFLGWRGIRFSLSNLGLFKTQIRAVYRAGAAGPAHLMFPMITGVEELRAALAICEEARAELQREGRPYAADMPVGIMVETPSAAAVADLLARECAFMSIGSNDLIQYTLAMDRGNRRVSYLYRPLHPAILRAIRHVVDAGHAAGIWVGLCGEMGSETRLAEVLLGLGLDEISMHSAALPKIKQVIRWTAFSEARRVVDTLLELATADETDAWLAAYVAERKRSREPGETAS
ncbi:MAG TPA: phosphoenolpyruvate--protein phosphotransferase [Candidatus Krumholzibacteria bacterium]|nr:phosphoenolpyruvate--protein phosphotransferase [Candidatus Krumholzibacteria bacterium]HPD71297.1 phosphoenolpyruvate--protein phosphotransferase [Candidatus Krumholzibacteria bacterium]HRY39003.1 phosphoenolpyruvate--protein phosphotransferase [Candidatus Krumholzibacteria bacterium]